MLRSPTIAGVLLLCSVLGGGAQAQTMSYAQAGALIARDCGADIERHCRTVNLGNGALFNCLSENKAKVSPQCFADIDAVKASLARRIAAQHDALSLCAPDAAKLCQGVVAGDANILNCLQTASRAVSTRCKAALTDAGWQ